VSTYFVPERNTSAEDSSSSSSSSSQLTAYFRGRKLDGTSITLPSKVTGLILRESANTSSSDKGAVGTPDKLSSTGEDEHQISKSALAALMAEEDDEDEGGGGGGSSDGEIEDGGGLWGSGMAIFMDEEDDEEARGGNGNSDKVAGKKRKAEDGDSSNAPSSSSSTSATASFAPKREYQIDAKFSTLTSWSHDRPGTDHDLVNVAVEWIEVARVLHDSS